MLNFLIDAVLCDAETLLIKKGGDRRESSPCLCLIKDGVHHCGTAGSPGWVLKTAQPPRCISS